VPYSVDPAGRRSEPHGWPLGVRCRPRHRPMTSGCWRATPEAAGTYRDDVTSVALRSVTHDQREPAETDELTWCRATRTSPSLTSTRFSARPESSRVLAPNLRDERFLFSRQGLLDAFHYRGNGVTVRGTGLAIIGAQAVKTASADFSALPIRKACL
jgi:hypothetical protein